MIKHAIFITFSLNLLMSEAVVSETHNGKEFDRLFEMSMTDLVEMDSLAQVEVGSRGKAIDFLQTKVPVDVITAEQIDRTGHTELSRVLQRFIPGFNFPRPSIKDGSDHIRPFTLRGMAPDQVLVLVNGKRLHASTLLHVNGTIGRGSTGVDLNTIPLRSIERIEVLRDGAAAQYGSDAIAGIINIILKSGGEYSRVTSTIGQTYEGDGELYQADFHHATELPLDGFFNLTAELRDRNPTNRAIFDGRQQYFDGHPGNSNLARLTNRRGDPDTQDILFSLNSEIPFSDELIFYVHGSMNYRHGEAGAFFRRPLDDRNVRAIYPDGFLPLIKPDILDYSATVGSKGKTDFKLNWDFSHTVGGSHLGYDIENSVNASLGTASPTSFDAGSLHFRQHTTNLDLTRELDAGFKAPLRMAAGLEWRYENFQIRAGDEASSVNGGVPVLDGPNAGNVTMAGAQGFPGFMPANRLEEDRHNFSAYIDLDGKFDDKWFVGAAGRYEYYSDFGSSLNGKFSLAYRALDELLLRGSVSTGFRAPSLQQSFFNSTSSININNTLTSTSTLSVDAPIAQALGATSLKAEESLHFTAGLVFEPLSNLSFSADYFYTRIDNRIIFSRNITSSISPEIASILATGNLSAARFFTNAIDTETHGFDLRADYRLDFQNFGELKLAALYHYNRTRIKGGVSSPTILGENGGSIIFSEADRERLESGQPHETLILSANYKNGDFNGLFKLIKAGNFSEESQRLGSQWLADIDLDYRLDKHFNIGLGVHNLFDSEPDRNGQDGAYLQSSPYGYNGGFYYLRLSATF